MQACELPSHCGRPCRSELAREPTGSLREQARSCRVPLTLLLWLWLCLCAPVTLAQDDIGGINLPGAATTCFGMLGITEARAAAEHALRLRQSGQQRVRRQQ